MKKKASSIATSEAVVSADVYAVVDKKGKSILNGLQLSIVNLTHRKEMRVPNMHVCPATACQEHKLSMA